MFSRAKDFTFLISSSVGAEKLLPLIDKYLGNLPNSEIETDLSASSMGGDVTQGPVKKILEVPSIPSENVMLSVQYFKRVELSDWKTRLQIKILAEALSTRINQLRYVKRRGIYDRSIGYYANNAVCRPGISITIPTIEEQGDSILGDIQDILLELSSEPLKQEELNTVLQQKILPGYMVGWEENVAKTMEHLYNYYRYGILSPEKSKVKDYISSLTPDKIREFAQKFFIADNSYVIFGKSSIQ